MEDIEGYIELNRHDGKKAITFCVCEDSMVNAHIHEGDLVFVKQTNKGNLEVLRLYLWVRSNIKACFI